MLNTHLQNPSRVVLLTLVTLLTIVSFFAAPGQAAAVVDEPKAQILVIIVNNKVVPKAKDQEVIITRAENGCAPVTDIMKGLALCKGDRLVTAAGVQVKIAFNDPKNRDIVVIGSPDAESEITISSANCNLKCQIFVSLVNPLSNFFSKPRQRVTFTNRGTVYEVKGEEDGSASLFVYEGEVDVSKSVEPTPAATPDATEAATPTAVSDSPAVTARSLTTMSISKDGELGRPQKMSDTEVCERLASSSAAEIAMHTTPPEVAGNVAKFPNFRDIAERTRAFRITRCESFLHPEQPLNLETLGFIYNDWGNAEQALVFFNKAAEKWRKTLTGWTARERLRINRAVALRQLHQPDDALKELEPMITEPEFLGDALNVRGSIYYDKARNELMADRSELGVQRARENLNRADQDYQAAKGRGSQQQQYIKVNRAQVLKTRADIAQRAGDIAQSQGKVEERDRNYNDAIENYVTAINELGDAYGRTGQNNPNNKIAGLLVARARAALANTYAAMGKTRESFTSYDLAETTYNQAITEDSGFANAYCGLASLLLIRGNPVDAAANYEKCVTYSTQALVTEVEVPDVVGLRRATAIQTLAEAGLIPEIVTDGESVGSQDPPVPQQGDPPKIKIGAKVKLTMKIPDRE
jgi:tetratricopeptide (TPR) repeat protein